MTTGVRDLTTQERSILEFLLAGDWDGASALRAQLASAKHAGSWSAATASFDITVASDAPRATLADDSTPECVVSSEGGLAVGELFLRVENGVLIGLESSTFEGDPTALPPVEQLVSHADFEARGCTPF